MNVSLGCDVRAGISSTALCERMKVPLTELAAILERRALQGAARPGQTSTHWLRDTHGALAGAADTPTVAQNNLGHASLPPFMSPARRSACIRGCRCFGSGGACRDVRGIDSNPPSVNDNRFVEYGCNTYSQAVPRDAFCTISCAASHLLRISIAKQERCPIKTLPEPCCH